MLLHMICALGPRSGLRGKSVLQRWIDAWLENSVSLTSSDSNKSLYRGLVYAARLAFTDHPVPDVAFTAAPKSLVLIDSGSLGPLIEHSTALRRQVERVAAELLVQLRRNTWARLLKAMPDSRSPDELESLVKVAGLNPASVSLDLQPAHGAFEVLRRVQAKRGSLSQHGLLPTGDLQLAQLLRCFELHRTLLLMPMFVQHPALHPDLAPTLAATRHRLRQTLQALDRHHAKCDIPTVSAPLEVIVEALKALTDSDAAFRVVKHNIRYVEVEEGLRNSGKNPDDDPPLARILVDAALAAQVECHGLDFEDGLLAAWVLYSNYNTHPFEQMAPAARNQIRKLVPLIEAAQRYCDDEQIEPAAARLLVSRIWLLAVIHQTARDVQRQAICTAYMDLFMHFHALKKKKRDFIEAPLIYWTQGLGAAQEHIDADLARDALPQPPDAGRDSLLKKILQRAAFDFHWDLNLEPVSAAYDSQILTQKIGRKCHSEYSIHNNWARPTQSKYYFEQVYASIRPPAEVVPVWRERQAPKVQP